ncbi:MAG TPA: LTA synthase family protein, partial [Nitrospiraceae bacterium]
LIALALVVWWIVFRIVILPFLQHWKLRASVANAALGIALLLGVLGFHPKGPEAIRTVRISNGVYYTLAQNPILYAGDALRATVSAQWSEEARLQKGIGPDSNWQPLPSIPGQQEPRSRLDPQQTAGAVSVAQAMLARGETFPFPKYPLVRTQHAQSGIRFNKPANVLLLFIEALDRRFLGRTVNGIRVTPFLDRLKDQSLFVENFFANGGQTARGLFATFCSYYPRRGLATMKTRYTHDFLCLPEVLSKAGYHTEMVIGFDRDLNRLQVFLSRNGMQHILDESDFPPGSPRMGAAASLGFPDGALFDVVQERINNLQAAKRPFLLAAMTLTTHHPFHVPSGHPEVDALRANPDGYLMALRYLDLELERFFSTLRDKGLLHNTVVFMFGDHGRHEHVGDTAIEKQVGHFLTPLYLWMDDSLRTPATYHPRSVTTVASQVDITPTILAMNGLMPDIAPFLGQDLSCLLVRDCIQDNFAYLISPYGDEVIGLADQKGILLYGLRTEMLTHVNLALGSLDLTPLKTDAGLEMRYRQLESLYVTSNSLLERNLIWSRKDLEAQLVAPNIRRSGDMSSTAH